MDDRTDAVYLDLLSRLTAARDFALLAYYQAQTPFSADHEKACVKHMQLAAAALGYELVRHHPKPEPMTPDTLIAMRSAEGCAEAELYQGAPIYAGPDDGLQMDDGGNITGGR